MTEEYANMDVDEQMDGMPLHDATMREAVDRDLEPISYHVEKGGWRYGWKVRNHEKGGIVACFPGDERNTRIRAHEMRFVQFIGKGTLTNRPLSPMKEGNRT